MNMVNLKKITLILLAVVATFALVTVFAVFRVGHQHQEAAIAFWGDQYAPDEDAGSMDWGFVGNVVIPKGGPMIATDIAGCTDTPLPMVPIKVNGEGKGQVLCGVGSDAIVTGFDVENIQDAELRDAVIEVLNSEFGKSELVQ
jgi:hypothetical protein